MKTLIIDSSFIAHRFIHIVDIRELSFSEIKTGVVFSFLKQVLRTAKKFKASRVIFAWDSRQSKRKEIFPDYKRHREKIKTDPGKDKVMKNLYSQIDILKNTVLPDLGFLNSFEADGFEADDIIAKVCRQLKFDDLVIVTSDNDLYQLIRPKCSIFNLKKNFTQKDFERKYGISPKEWYKVKALAGCPTDGVHGIGGIGEKRAIDYLKGNALSQKYRRAIIDGKDIYEMNLKLVELPFKGLKSFHISKMEKFSIKKYNNVCRKYGFWTMLYGPDFKTWKNIFCKL